MVLGKYAGYTLSNFESDNTVVFCLKQFVFIGAVSLQNTVAHYLVRFRSLVS